MTQERVGDYELLEYLTAGGMADLYLARSPRQDRPVVLKTIQRRYVELTRVVRMFIDEGRIAKALDHPNIVRIHDVGAEQGAYFIAMERIVGRDLLAIARRGIEAGHFLPLHLAVAIIAQVANGLTYAHEKRDTDGRALRVVHCDVSPGNVVVSFGGTAKIVDFGIARAAIQLRAEDHTVAGKYNYMAPEQIRGEALDARADLFSLGVILYELTVGRRLFRGRPEEVKARILSGDIPAPRSVRPEIPEALERVILRSLALAPSERYASAREMRRALLDFLAASGARAGKREIAEYLHAIFAPERPADRADAERAIGTDGFSEEGDEDLALQAPVPGLAELVVDPDDPEPEPLRAEGPTTEPPSAPTPSPAQNSAKNPAQTPAQTPTATPPAHPSARVETHPAASRAELAFALLALLVAVSLYFLVRS